MRAWSEPHILKNRGKHVEPVLWAAAEAIKCFVEEPELIFVEGRVTNRRSHDCLFTVRELGVAESILAISLLEDAAFADCFREE